MRRAALLAVLLLVSTPAAAGAPATPTADRSHWGAGRVDLLTLDAEQRSAVATASLDVGAALAVRRNVTAVRLDRYALATRFAAVDGPTRRDVLFSAVVDARAMSSALRERERALRGAYRNGSINTPALLRGLASVRAESAALEGYLDAVVAHAEQVPGITLRTRLASIQNRVVEFGDPVRGRALASIRGTSAPSRLYVAVSRDGVELATLAGDRYRRAAYRVDRRAGDPVQVPPEEFGELIRTYPTAYNRSLSQGLDSSGNGIYAVRYEYEDGSLVAYVHGGTREVFYEVRDRRAGAIASDETATAAANGTRLRINRSFPGGPLRVAVADNATGEPVSATVVVDGTRLGTGDDGVAWTLMPDTARLAVTAVRPGGNVTTFVRPLAPAGSGDG